MTKRIKVSVILPVFNEERYIHKCIESLMKQDYPMDEMEWIFVDGVSEDKTVEIISSYIGECPIVLLKNSKRKTPYALNMAIENAKGDYIIRMDAHAEFPENYISKCVFYLEKKDADNVGGIAETEAEGFIGSAISHMLSTKFGVGESNFRVGKGDRYVDTVPFGAFKREVFDKVGLFNTKLIRSEDNDMNARIREKGGKIWLANDIRFTYYCRDTVKGILKMGMQNGNALFRTLKENPKAMSIRHFIPFLFVISIIVLPVLATIFPFFTYIALGEVVAYLLLDLYFSFVHSSPFLAMITIWLYPLFHISYGLGSLLGLIGVSLY